MWSELEGRWLRPDQERGRPVFLGTHSPRLDDKGRLILPAKFRDQLAPGVVITRGQERCLYVFTAAEIERMHESVRQVPTAGKQARDYLRVLLSGAYDELPDKQGRITIPAQLRTYANLDRDVTDRGRLPGGDLGHRGLGDLPVRAGGRVRHHRGGGGPRHVLTAAAGRGARSPAVRDVLTHLPRCQAERRMET